MSATHTPGPWHAGDPSFGYFHIYSKHTVRGELCKQGKQAICTAPSTSKKAAPFYHEMFAANARLIAAAPELLDLLDQALAYTSCPSWSPSLTKEIESAIAKATGATQ